MFNIDMSSNEDPDLNKPIKQVLSQMDGELADSDEYSKMIDNLTKLYELKKIDSSERVSKDTLLIVGGNLAGILLIVGHERAHLLGSKALNFVLKAK